MHKKAEIKEKLHSASNALLYVSLHVGLRTVELQTDVAGPSVGYRERFSLLPVFVPRQANLSLQYVPAQLRYAAAQHTQTLEFVSRVLPSVPDFDKKSVAWGTRANVGVDAGETVWPQFEIYLRSQTDM